MDIGTVLLMLGLSYGLGLLWYDVPPGELPAQIWRIAAYSFIGIFVAEAAIAPFFTADLQFGGLHLISAFVGSLVAVIVDWIIAQACHPTTVHLPEARTD
jgi:hypothetical protein